MMAPDKEFRVYSEFIEEFRPKYLIFDWSNILMCEFKILPLVITHGAEYSPFKYKDHEVRIRHGENTDC